MCAPGLGDRSSRRWTPPVPPRHARSALAGRGGAHRPFAPRPPPPARSRARSDSAAVCGRRDGPKRPPWRSASVATRPRPSAAAAHSRGVQWLMGRPASAGGSQASAMSWPHGSTRKVAGAPGRGASCTRSGLDPVGRASPYRRHRRPGRRLVSRRRATSRVWDPSARGSSIWVRNLNCWGVVWARMRGRISWRSSGERDTAGALGPGRADSLRRMPCERTGGSDGTSGGLSPQGQLFSAWLS